MVYLQFNVYWEMGMLWVIFNIVAGIYYSKSTFIVTLKKQEKLVFKIFYTFGYINVFLPKNIMGTRVSKYFQFQVSGSRNTQKHTDHYRTATIFVRFPAYTMTITVQILIS